MKDSGVVESCIKAHFDGNSLSFDNMKKSFGNGPTRNFFNVAIIHFDFRGRKCLKNIENFKIVQNVWLKCQTIPY